MGWAPQVQGSAQAGRDLKITVAVPSGSSRPRLPGALAEALPAVTAQQGSARTWAQGTLDIGVWSWASGGRPAK